MRWWLGFINHQIGFMSAWLTVKSAEPFRRWGQPCRNTSIVGKCVCSLFLNNVKSKQQVQLWGYFNPWVVPKRLMGVFKLPGTAGSLHPFPICHVKTFKWTDCFFFYFTHFLLGIFNVLMMTGCQHVFLCCVGHCWHIPDIYLSLSFSHPRSQS